MIIEVNALDTYMDEKQKIRFRNKTLYINPRRIIFIYPDIWHEKTCWTVNLDGANFKVDDKELKRLHTHWGCS